jgi:hypothetical protein
MMDSTGLNPLRLIEEVSRRLADLVPPEATTHFLRAQKELVLGLTAIIEHRSRPATPAPRAGRRPAAATSRTRRPRRVSVV